MLLSLSRKRGSEQVRCGMPCVKTNGCWKLFERKSEQCRKACVDFESASPESNLHDTTSLRLKGGSFSPVNGDSSSHCRALGRITPAQSRSSTNGHPCVAFQPMDSVALCLAQLVHVCLVGVGVQPTTSEISYSST